MPGSLDLRFMRIKLVLDEVPRRLDDQFLLFRQAEIHRFQPFVLPDNFFLDFLSALAFFSTLSALVAFSGFSLAIFPGGYTIGGLLLANLVASHLFRFKLTWPKSGIYLAHSGRMGGARPGQRKAGFRDFLDDGVWRPLVWPDGEESEALIVAPLRMAA